MGGTQEASDGELKGFNGTKAPGVVAFKAAHVYSTGVNGKDIMARPGPRAGASVASVAGVGGPGVILASLARICGGGRIEGLVWADTCCAHVAGSERLGSRLRGLWRARGEHRGERARGVVDRRGVSWIVPGTTRGVNYPWIAAQSALGFGGRRRSGIRDPCRGFPGLGLHQCGVRSPYREAASPEATKGRVSQRTGEHVEAGVRS